MKKLYAFCYLIFACVVYLTPAHEAFAILHGHVAQTIYDYPCPQVSQNWCTDLVSGYTKITPAPITSGGCNVSGSNTANTTATCVVAVDNAIEATVTASIAGITGTTAELTINSGTGIVTGGTMSDGGVNVLPATGITVGTQIDATHWNLICTSGCATLTVASQSMNELVGNDATCKAQNPTGITTNFDLSSFSASTRCLTLVTAQGKYRNNSPDWLVLQKGDTWTGALFGATNASWQPLPPPSSASIGLISAYGTGARPIIEKIQTSTDIAGMVFSGSRGNNMAVIGIETYSATADPASGQALVAKITGSTGLANCGATNLICNISPAVPSFVVNNLGGVAFQAYGSGIQAVTVTYSSGAPTQLTLGSTVSASQTNIPIEISSYQSSGGISLTPNIGSGLPWFMLLEDNYFKYGALSNQLGGNPESLLVLQLRIRRNITDHTWVDSPFLGASYPQAGGYVLLEENVYDYVGWDPNVWAGGQNVFTHCIYDHDPSVPYIINRNIFANCTSTAAQQREGATVYNNATIASPWAWSPQATFQNAVYSYNVMDHGNDYNYGSLRYATATSASGTTTLYFDGQSDKGGASFVGAMVANLDNPGALLSSGYPNMPTIGALATPSSATLASGKGTASTVQPGVRGDGVQVGDRLQFGSIYNIGIGFQAIGGTYPNAGPGVGGTTIAYPIQSVVSISAANPAVVTDTAKRQNDELVKFLNGSPPSPLVTGTDYCTTNVSGLTYNLYTPTSNACPGVVTAIDTSAGVAASGIGRTGSRRFSFTQAVANIPGWPSFPIPSYVVPGMSVCAGGSVTGLAMFAAAEFAGHTSGTSLFIDGGTPPTAGQLLVAAGVSGFLTISGSSSPFTLSSSAGTVASEPMASVTSEYGACTTVEWISSDFLTMQTAGGTANVFSGQDQVKMFFDLPNVHVSNPTQRFGPNNIIANGASVSEISANGAIYLGNNSNNTDVSGNYVYNIDFRTPASTYQVIDSSQFSSTDNITQVLNETNATDHSRGSFDAYDASLNAPFSATITANTQPNAVGGAVLTVLSGTGPNVGDVVFDAVGGTAVAQYTHVVLQLTSSTWLLDTAQTISSPINMISGSYSHFIAQAKLNSHDSRNAAYTAGPANNYIRSTGFSCGNQTLYPGSPSCPPQPYN